MRNRLNRRQLFKGLAAAAAAASVQGDAPVRAAQNPDARFLIVIPGFGGAQLLRSVLPIRASEAGAAAQYLDVLADNEVVDIPDTQIRAADVRLDHVLGQEIQSELDVALSPFVYNHRKEMMVTTLTGTSVNHAVAQHRALTGGGAWNGRTLQEVVAMTYGKDYPLPNVNMSGMGYLEHGTDDTIPARVRGEPIAQPLVKPLSFSAHKGLRPGGEDVPAGSLVDKARALRNDHLDPESSFYQTFRLSERLKLWMRQRSVDAAHIEDEALIDELFFLPEIEGVLPLSEYGLTASPNAELLAQVFPDMYSDEPDPLQQQAALAYLLITSHASVTVTLSPTFTPVFGGPFGIKTPPLAFDNSHQDHRAAQALMWFRIFDVADRLIGLLKQTPFNPETGESFWDRTMVHFPTDFGRTKTRPDGAKIWGTGHDLNNGHVTISPLVRGGEVLGGVNPMTGMTYGFNPSDGAPDPNRNTTEAESFAGLLQALGVDTAEAGLPDMPAMRA